ncbi:MAG: Stp1/IreP family PP2C-type Ser/Thr phosphatase [Selenomonadaceae bacterium]|nr:Stp1/IreP family PP2C-type Ser/Thr phosphatase [Selenomonadaceae bacterium]
MKVLSKYFQATNVGKVRKQNEDAIAIIEPETYLVADGMGGQAAGEVASKMLVDTVESELKSTPQLWNEEILKSAILTANEKILSAAKNNLDYQGMGTTATILHISKSLESQTGFIIQTAYYAHVGDSRLYKLDCENLEQITQDHSYVEELVRRGEITEAQARVHPLKNLLTQAVGVKNDLEVATGQFKVKHGDIFLLCTDGLTNMVNDYEIAKILNSSENPADDLIKAALDHGGRDNVSAIVLGII